METRTNETTELTDTELDGVDGGRATDQLTLNFSKIEFEYIKPVDSFDRVTR